VTINDSDRNKEKSKIREINHPNQTLSKFNIFPSSELCGSDKFLTDFLVVSFFSLQLVLAMRSSLQISH